MSKFNKVYFFYYITSVIDLNIIVLFNCQPTILFFHLFIYL